MANPLKLYQSLNEHLDYINMIRLGTFVKFLLTDFWAMIKKLLSLGLWRKLHSNNSLLWLHIITLSSGAVCRLFAVDHIALTGKRRSREQGGSRSWFTSSGCEQILTQTRRFNPLKGQHAWPLILTHFIFIKKTTFGHSKNTWAHTLRLVDFCQHLLKSSLSWLAGSDFSPRMVSISSCMKAQGTVEPCSGHRSPLGQNACSSSFSLLSFLFFAPKRRTRFYVC